MQTTAEVYCGALEAAVSQVLEEIAFAFVEPGDAAAAPPDDLVGAEIHFEGPETGTIVLALPHDFATELAANMLGADSAEGDDASQGALLEVLNILGGLVLEGAYGREVATSLALPALTPATPDALHALARDAAGASVVVADDEHPVWTYLVVDDRGAQPAAAA